MSQQGWRRIGAAVVTTVVAALLAVGTAQVAAAAPSDGLYSWGQNDQGQLGTGTTDSEATPFAVGLPSAVSAAAGLGHSLAILADGTVQAWGDNSSGQLGDGSATDQLTPVAVPGLTGAVAVAAGFNHSLALLADGTVRAWGDNADGQLGDGTTDNRPSPVTVPGLDDVVAVSAGLAHSAALLEDGTVRAWGDNQFGQVGDGTTTDRPSPVTVPGLSGVTGLAAGGAHTLALLADGTVRAWGNDELGQLGDDATTNQPSPIVVGGLAGVVSVAGGFANSGAVLSDGTAMMWGSNESGQIGDGTTTERHVPTPVDGLSHVSAISIGGFHTLALRTDGTAMAWGENGSGQLGDGSGTNQTLPVTVADIASVGAIAAGLGHSLGIVSALSATLDPLSLSFGPVSVGGFAVLPVTLSNTGPSTLKAVSPSATGDFSIDAGTTDCPSDLASGASCTIGVTFAPTAIGSRTGLLSVAATGLAPRTAALSGTGVNPVATFLPAAQAFGDVRVGTSSSSDQTIRNDGTHPLVITALGVTGPAAGDYALDAPLLPLTLDPDESTTFSIEFTPAASGARSASLSVTDNTAGSPHTVALSGTGVEPLASLEPLSLTFPARQIGTTSPAEVATLSNPGSAPLVVHDLVVTGPDAADFDVVWDTCPPTVAASASCSIGVAFSPTVSGTRSAALTAVHDAPDGISSIPLAGAGVNPVAFLADPTIDLGEVRLDRTSVEHTTRVENRGTGELVIDGVDLVGADADEFDITEDSCTGAHLDPGEFCELAFTFAPTGAAGPRSIHAMVTDNAGNSPQAIRLVGTGVVPVVTPNPAQLGMGTVAVGATAARRSVTLTNTGTGSIAVTAIDFSAAGAGPFDVETPALPVSLPPGSSTSFSVGFAPTAPGPESATVEVTDDTGTVSPVVVTGTGTTPEADVKLVLKSKPRTASPGSVITYVATASNSGPAPAADLSLSFPLPASTTFVSMSASPGWSCDAPTAGEAGTVSCTRSALGLGSRAGIKVKVEIDPSATGSLVATASISASTSDPDPANNTPSVTTQLA